MTTFNEDFWKKFDEHVGIVVDDKLNERLGLEPGQTLDDKLSYLPTREEFFAREDEVLKELKTVREEMQILNGLHEKVNSNVDNVEKLQKIHPNNKHVLAA